MGRRIEDMFRPATRGFPETEAEWDLRPYFIYDYDISWRQFRDFLRGDDEQARGWALARLLDEARYNDIWRLITPADIERDLDRLPRRVKEMWAGALSAWAEA